NTTATFGTAGDYVLRLTANDGSLVASDELQVTVTDPTGAAGIVGRWKFEGDLNDASGMGNHATLVGASLGSGYSGGGLLVSAGSQRAEVADHASFAMNESITLAAWIKPESQGT